MLTWRNSVMKKLIPFLIILAMAGWPLHTVKAHHAAHYKTLWEAYKKKDLESAKALFSEACWKGTGKEGEMSGKALSDLLKKATQVEKDVVHEYSSPVNCILGIQFYVSGEAKPRRYWLLSEAVHDKRNGNSDALKYRVMKITKIHRLAAAHIKRARQHWLGFRDFPRREADQGENGKVDESESP